MLGSGTKAVGCYKVLLLAGLTMLGASTAPAATQEDPWEGFNRAVFRFNDTLDTYTLKPLARGYQAVTPDYVEARIDNVFGNLGDVVNLGNDLLQGKIHAAGIDTSRLLFNSTLGVFGLFDVASEMGLPRSDEDFGQTLGYWGLGSGPYLVLPVFGPGSVRDAFGRLPDNVLQPYPYVRDVHARNTLFGLDKVSMRAGLLSSEKMITGDRYVFIRNAYLQNREFRVQDGQVVDDF